MLYYYNYAIPTMQIINNLNVYMEPFKIPVFSVLHPNNQRFPVFFPSIHSNPPLYKYI